MQGLVLMSIEASNILSRPVLVGPKRPKVRVGNYELPMRRWGNLFAAVAAPLFLWRAWRRFRRGKRKRPSVLAFEQRAEREVLLLARQLDAATYCPGQFRKLLLREPKRRLIAAAPVRDRVVHHAIHGALAPLLDRGLVDSTFACLEGRGSHRAVLACWQSMRRWRYVLALDIRHYFLSIDRGILLHEVMARRIKDWRLLELLRTVAGSGAGLYRGRQVVELLQLPAGFPPIGCGLPIGNLTSQWWGNHYLSGLDHYIKRQLKVPGYQRYMDDLTLFADSRSQLLEARQAIAEWLLWHRKLLLKRPAAEPRSTRRPLSYLGYRVGRGGVAPLRGVLQRLERRVAERLHSGDAEAVERTLAAYKGVVTFVG